MVGTCLDIVHTDWFVYCKHCDADHLADVVCVSL